MSGYDIKKTVEGSISNFWSESYGQIYPILRRLVDEGLARRKTRASAGGRDRHVYSITDAGRADLERWLGEPTSPRPLRNELLLKLFFARHADHAARVRQLEQFREQELESRERYARIRAELESKAAGQPDLAYWLMTLRYGEIETEAHLDWCEEMLAQLRADQDRYAPGTASEPDKEPPHVDPT